MNLQEIFHDKQKNFAFTLIELLLVIAIIAIVGLFTSPIGISFYQSQLLNETSSGLLSALRQAQSFSVSGKHDNPFGVYISQDSYVIFEGDSYLSRIESEDQVFMKVSGVDISGSNEIVFSEITGEPSFVGTLFISSGNKQAQIEVRESGNIE